MITIIWGKPRSGKTTLMARYVAKNYNRIFKKNRYSVIYSTDSSIKGTVPITYQELGTFKPPVHSLLLLCEAGVGLNNREWKKLTPFTRELFAMHGHNKIDIIADSQTLDIDIALRERVEKQYLVRRFLPNISVVYRVRYNLDVNNDTEDLKECYSRPRGIKVIFAFITGDAWFLRRKKYYKWFDSYKWDTIYPKEPPSTPRTLTPKEEKKQKRHIS